MSQQTTQAPIKRALRINEFCAAYGVSRSSAYLMIRDGRLRTVLLAGRRLVPTDSAEALIRVRSASSAEV